MKRKHLWYWVVILLVSIVPLIDLFHPGFPVTHDGQDHVARIANFYQSLSEGNIVPRWAGNLNWGYGHPVMMFLYPLPSYVASFFHFVGFSLVDSTKLVFALAFVTSMLAMYGWARKVWGEEAGVAASLLYGFAPYRFVDLYVRGAIGEHVAFVFLPVILWGLWELSQSTKRMSLPFLGISLGTAGLILSHNALSLMFLPIAGCYALYLYFSNTKKSMRFLAVSAAAVGLGLLLSTFFWMPAFFEGKYTLRDIVTAGDFRTRFVPWTWFIVSPWNYGGGNDFTKAIGWAQLVGILMLLFGIRMMARKHRAFALGIGVILFVSLFLMTSVSLPVWEKASLLQKFQFPWRLMSVTVFAAATLSALGIAALKGRWRMYVLVIIVAIAIGTTSFMWRANNYKSYPESFFTGIYNGTTDTGESSPIWSVRFMEHAPNTPMEVIDGEARIRTVSRSSTRHMYEADVSKASRVLENTLYFPGWNVLVDGRAVAVEFQNPAYRGLITFLLPVGTHRVDVVFGETKLRFVADWISIGAAVIFLGILGTMRLWRKRIYR